MVAVIGRTAISRHHSRLGYVQQLLGAGRYSIAGRFFFSSGGYASLMVQGASRRNEWNVRSTEYGVWELVKDLLNVRDFGKKDEMANRCIYTKRGVRCFSLWLAR